VNGENIGKKGTPAPHSWRRGGYEPSIRLGWLSIIIFPRYYIRKATLHSHTHRRRSKSFHIMPPLPTSFDDATSTSITSIQRRQNDLREFQIPRLRDCSESLAVQQQYAAELREDLETITHLVEVSTHDYFFLFEFVLKGWQ
jgi:hypothetical protein